MTEPESYIGEPVERSGLAVMLDEAGFDLQERHEFAGTFVANHPDERLPNAFITPKVYELSLRDSRELPQGPPNSLGKFTLREEIATAFKALRRIAAGQRKNW